MAYINSRLVPSTSMHMGWERVWEVGWVHSFFANAINYCLLGFDGKPNLDQTKFQSKDIVRNESILYYLKRLFCVVVSTLGLQYIFLWISFLFLFFATTMWIMNIIFNLHVLGKWTGKYGEGCREDIQLCTKQRGYWECHTRRRTIRKWVNSSFFLV